MQSLFSVFRRPAPPTNFAERRRSSATAASVPSVAYNDTQPRHLGKSDTPPSAPPKPAAKAAVPPPPRSRQVSPKQSVEIPSAVATDVESGDRQYMPLYVAVYASGEQQQSKGTWRMALHLGAEQNKVVKYSTRSDEASNGAQSSNATCEVETIDTALEMDLVARVLIGHVLKTGSTTTDASDFENTSTKISNLLSTIPVSQTAISTSGMETHSSRFWLMAAITSLRTSGHLIETPSSTSTNTSTTTNASTTTNSTDTASSTSKPTNPPVTRPDLISRPTDNWNDLPADFLSPDAPAGGSHRRKMRNSTPRITPKSSSGQLGEVGVMAATKPPVTSLDGSAKPEEPHGVKSAEALVQIAEDWAVKCQQQRVAGEEEVVGSDEGGAAGRVRTLDARSALEVDA